MIPLNPARPGFSTISPFLSVEDPLQQLEFIRAVFTPEITQQASSNPDGRFELKMGNSSLIISKKQASAASRFNTLYVYVKNIRETYLRAMGAGASSLYEPFERYNGDMECGFVDMNGNYWICAKFEKLLSQELMAQRLKKSGSSSI
jgi:uncharacterized glyoxalase superfamily protein PhnB